MEFDATNQRQVARETAIHGRIACHASIILFIATRSAIENRDNELSR